MTSSIWQLGLAPAAILHPAELVTQHQTSLCYVVLLLQTQCQTYACAYTSTYPCSLGGASTCVSIALDVIEKCFGQRRGGNQQHSWQSGNCNGEHALRAVDG